MKKIEHYQQKSILIYDDQFFRGKDGVHYSNEAHIVFMLKYRHYFKQLGLISRYRKEPCTGPYRIPSEVCVHKLPHYESVIDLMFRLPLLLPRIYLIVRNVLPKYDYFMCSWPTPVSLLMLVLHHYLPGKTKRQSMILVRQNMNKLVELRYTGWRRTLGLLLCRFLDRQFHRYGKSAIVFPVGAEMYAHYSKLHNHTILMTLPLVSRADIPDEIKLKPIDIKGRIKLLFVGRLDKEKALDIMLHALKILVTHFPEVELDLVGEGTEESELRQLATELGIEERVHFLGYVGFGQELYDLYRQADVFVISSLSEGFPKVIVEAMVMGTPVVATEVGGIPNVIHHGENGWLVAPGSPECLAAGVQQVLEDPQLYASLRRQAAEESEYYTCENQIERMLQYMNECHADPETRPRER